METGKRVFPPEFKRDALDLIERSGKPLAEAGTRFGHLGQYPSWLETPDESPLCAIINDGSR